MRISIAVALLVALSSGGSAPPAGQVTSVSDAAAFTSPDGRGTFRLVLEPRREGEAYLGRATLLPGAGAPAHRHAGSEEIVLILAGRGAMTLAGETFHVGPGTAVRIPAGSEHAFQVTGDEAMEIVQVYNPGGPESRFRSWSPATEAKEGGRP